MIEHEVKELFNKRSVDKQFYIKYGNGTITNLELRQESFTLTETLCSEPELTFGCCEASSISFLVSRVFTALKNDLLDVSVVLDRNADNAFKIGKYKVYSSVPTADRKEKEVLAYDAMYDVINADVATWYNSILPNADSSVTLRAFRYSFFDYFGLEQVEITLPNDDMVVKKTVQTDKLSGKDIVTAICEVNGCFGHINRDGKMDYVFLKERTDAIYPSDDLFPAEDLYPSGNNYETFNTGNYYGCQYEDYVVKKIDALEIREQENSVGISVGDGNNCYIINGNMLLLGKSAEELTVIAQKIFDVIKHIEYRPFEATMRANLCRELGDMVRFNTKYDIFYSYILERRVTGIQNLMDTMSANGEEYRTAQVNNLQNDVLQLRGKTNTLERTVELTRSEIKSVETKAQVYTDNEVANMAYILTNATDKKLKEYSTTTEMNTAIEQSAEAINLSVSEQIEETKKYADTSLEDYSTTTEMDAAIKLSADNITSEVSETYTTKEETTQLSSRVEQTADMIAIGIDANGNIVTDLTLDKNGMTFVGNYIVVSAENFQLNKDGEVMIRGIAYLDNGLSIYIPEYTKVSGYKFEAGYYNVVNAGKNSVKMGVLDSGDGTSTYMDFDREGFATLFANGQRVFHANEYGLFGTLFFDYIIGAENGIIGKVQGTDGTMRIPVGSTNEEKNAVAWMRAITNNDGITRIGINGLYGGSEYKSLYATVETSDARLKDDVSDTEVNALELINQIKHRQFIWREQNSKQNIGYIAQELEQIEKRMVIPPENNDEYYQVNTFYMMGLVTKAIQELSAENKELKSEIDELKKSVSILLGKLGGMSNE